MSPAEWDILPWWLQRTYLEGLEDEGVIKQEPMADDVSVDAMSDSTALGGLGIKVVEYG